jgi:hypothetical protein
VTDIATDEPGICRVCRQPHGRSLMARYCIKCLRGVDVSNYLKAIKGVKKRAADDLTDEEIERRIEQAERELRYRRIQSLNAR